MRAKQIPLDISAVVENKLKSKFLHADPNETGGLIFRDGNVVELPNEAQDRLHNFEADIFCDPQDVFAFWHTHPNGRPWISMKDRASMFEMAKAGFTFPWIVVGRLSITAWEATSDFTLTVPAIR